MVEGGTTGDGFFGRLPGERGVYEVWQWIGEPIETLKKDHVFALPSALPLLMFDAIVVPNGRYLGYVYRNQYRSNLLLSSCETGSIIKEWESPAPWHCDSAYGLGRSSNGAFSALVLPRNGGVASRRYAVGLIDLDTLQLKLVAELSGHGAGTIRQIAVSDDGRYIALGGWNNGAALVDASVRKVLWADRPPTEVSTGYVLFSSDGQTLYSAGSEGCVYTIETKTGKITGRWWATETGKSIYGHRISCLAMSPDGLWLAAGTGPEGHVYLWNTASADAKPRLLPHGIRTVLVVTFSPDSQRLASVAGGKIKVWSVNPSPVPPENSISAEGE